MTVTSQWLLDLGFDEHDSRIFGRATNGNHDSRVQNLNLHNSHLKISSLSLVFSHSISGSHSHSDSLYLKHILSLNLSSSETLYLTNSLLTHRLSGLQRETPRLTVNSMLISIFDMITRQIEVELQG